MTLDQLSAAAAQGEWGCYPSALGHKTICIRASPDFYAESLALTNEADAAFICQLVNAYRTGQLVAVADDAIERVARAILKAHVFDTTGFTEDAANAIADHAVQAWIPEAKAAIAAMKDTQP